MGPGSLIYLAALKGIPDELYEAADIDGAGFFQKIFTIVIPNLKALIIIQFIAAFIASAQQSGFILVMTFGGPNEATRVADLLIFEKAYLYLEFGIATTMAWILGMLLMGFTVIQLRKLSRMEFKTVDKV
jgi:multiple sugar transport system permease protein